MLLSSPYDRNARPSRTDRLTGGQTDRQTDRQTDGQTDEHHGNSTTVHAHHALKTVDEVLVMRYVRLFKSYGVSIITA